MENEKKSTTKRKLLITLISLVLCLLIIGVVVWAATSQNAEIVNTITINSSSGDARTTITISGTKSNSADLFAPDTTLPTDGLTEYLKKNYNQDSASATGPNLIFDSSEGYGYYVYKIDFANRHNSNVNFKIDLKTKDTEENPTNYVFNNQISVWFGKAEAISLKTADTETKDYNLTGNVLVEENSTYYLVVGANVDLIDLRPVATEHFDIIVTVSVA